MKREERAEAVYKFALWFHKQYGYFPTNYEICNGLEWWGKGGTDSIGLALRALAKAGKIMRIGHGRYELKPSA